MAREQPVIVQRQVRSDHVASDHEASDHVASDHVASDHVATVRTGKERSEERGDHRRENKERVVLDCSTLSFLLSPVLFAAEPQMEDRGIEPLTS